MAETSPDEVTRDQEVALLQEALREVQALYEAEYAARRALADEVKALRAARDAAQAELATLRKSRLWRLRGLLRRGGTG